MGRQFIVVFGNNRKQLLEFLDGIKTVIDSFHVHWSCLSPIVMLGDVDNSKVRRFSVLFITNG